MLQKMPYLVVYRVWNGAVQVLRFYMELETGVNYG